VYSCHRLENLNYWRCEMNKHFETGPFVEGDSKSRIFYDGKEVTPQEAAEICRRRLKDIVIQKIADAIRDNAGKLPAPTRFDVWATEYFKQPACGEVIYNAPVEFTRSNPKEAIEWYETNVSLMLEDEKDILLKKI